MASCEHACDLVRMHGESGWKARPRAGGAQVRRRVLPVGFGAVCALPVARSESAFARHAPRSRAFSAAALLTGSAAQTEEG